MTLLMITWVFFAYIPRILGSDNYVFSLVSLKIAWFATPLFFSFLYLLTVYLFSLEKNYKKTTYIVFTLGVSLSLVTGLTDFVIVDFIWIKNIIRIIYGPLMLFFLGGIFSLIILTFIPIIKNKKMIEGRKLGHFLYGLLIFYIFNAIFNIVLPVFFDISRFYFLGDYSTLVLLGFTAYSILRQELFNVKVLATESLSFVIWVTLFVRLVTSDTGQDKLINGLILFFVTLSVVLLIRSVIKEVRAREEIEELAARLELANLKLKQLDETKSDFLSIASHQLRTPLTAIKGYASMILEGSYGKIPEKTKSVVDKIFQSSQRLVLIIGDFLDISRIEQGTMQYDFLDFDIEELVRELANEFISMIEKSADKAKVLEIIFEAEEGESFYINADRNKIRQVISNLIDNAIKYTPGGFVKIKISKTSEKRNMLFTVEDSGVGMSAETMSNLFKKFGRARGLSSMYADGSGLGLYVAKEIITAHKGKIWAESAGGGKGSKFFVEMPA